MSEMSAESTGTGGVPHCRVLSKTDSVGVLRRRWGALPHRRRRFPSRGGLVAARHGRISSDGGTEGRRNGPSSAAAEVVTATFPSAASLLCGSSHQGGFFRRPLPRLRRLRRPRALATSPSTVESAPSRLRDPASGLGDACRSRRGVADLGAAPYRRATCQHTYDPSSHWTCPGGPSCGNTMLFLGRHDWRASSRSGLLISSTALWCPRRASA